MASDRENPNSNGGKASRELVFMKLYVMFMVGILMLSYGGLWLVVVRESFF
jgi:hypothetical protein